MPHQSTILIFLSMFITILISCNISTCRATRLLPPKPESPMLPNSEAPPPLQHGWPFPKLQWPMTNFPRHEQFRTHPKGAKFPPWIQDPTKAAEPTPPEQRSPPKFEEPKLLAPKPENSMLRPQPKVPSCHELKPIPKPKWPIPELSPTFEEPTPTKHQVTALPPLHEMPSLLSPELAPMPSVALVPSSAEAKHH